MRSVTTLPPSAECLSPVGEDILTKGVVDRLRPKFIEAVTRKPSAMRGQPFLVEIIIAYGCEADFGGSGDVDPVTGVYRTPVRQQGAAAILGVERRDTEGGQGRRPQPL